MDILRDAGCKVRILQMSGVKDPDEFVRAQGREGFLALAREAEPLVDYKLNAARRGCDLSKTEGSLTFLRRAAEILRSLSPVEAEVYIRKIAAETRISEGAIRREAWGHEAEAAAAPIRVSRGREADGAPPGAGSALERSFIRLLIADENYIARIRPYERVFETPAICRVYSAALSLCEEAGALELRRLEEALDPADRELLDDIRDNVRVAGREEEVFRECARSFRLSELAAWEKEIIGRLTVANEEENQERIIELTQELLRIQREMKGAKSR
jgi:DNA primase